MVYAPNQHLIHGALSPIARISGSSYQVLGRRSARLIIIPCDGLAKTLLPVPVTLGSAYLEISVPVGGMLPPGDTTMTPFNSKLIPSPGQLLVPLKQWSKGFWLG